MFDRNIEIKTPEQIDVMRRAGLVVGETLDLLRRTATAGMTTGELDEIARGHITSRGATSNFLGYGAHNRSGAGGFTGVICASINEQVVHGIPGDQALRQGDIISFDCGAIVDGWHGDAATTVAIGDVPADVSELMRVTEESLWQGIAAASLGGKVGDISHAVESYVRSQGTYGILDGYTGHGIGSAMHMAPDVPNKGKRGKGPKLVRGMALAVEPMVSLGSADSYTLADGWTVVTADGSWAAHYEHTFTLTDAGTWVLTALDGGEAKLAEMGVQFGGR